jgi:hypothetical protein
MGTHDIFTLGLGLMPPWRGATQHLDQERHPNERWLEVVAEPGASSG